jgi:hypothetical protein
MYTDNPNHGPALFMMNNGTITPNRPTLGAWLSYGLGSPNENLPEFVALCPGRPVRFAELWSSGFLPAKHQGVYVNHTNLDPKAMIPFLRNGKWSPDKQAKQLELLKELNRQSEEQSGVDPQMESMYLTFKRRPRRPGRLTASRTFLTDVYWPDGLSNAESGQSKSTMGMGSLGTLIRITTTRRGPCVRTSTDRFLRY